jgi:hypothetical protein
LEQNLDVNICLLYKFLQLQVRELLDGLGLLEIILIEILKVLVVNLLLVHKVLLGTWLLWLTNLLLGGLLRR